LKSKKRNIEIEEKNISISVFFFAKGEKKILNLLPSRKFLLSDRKFLLPDKKFLLSDKKFLLLSKKF
jgi:hypothetical protein